MFETMVPYYKVVSAARETAEKICAQARRTIQVGVTTQGGETASVSWGRTRATLNLPTMPADQMLSRAEANQIVGLIAHECCHVMHSDWQDWMLAVQLGDAIKALTNGIEDVRIEAAELKRKNLPGLKDALSDTCVLMHGKSLAAALASGQRIGQSPNHAAYVIATLGRLANGYRIPNAAGLTKGINPLWRPAIDHALRHLPKLRDTEGARMLAEQVFRMLQDAASRQPQPQQPRQPQQPKTDGQEADGQEADGQEADGQEADRQEADGQEADRQEADGQEADGQEADGQEADGQEAPGGSQEAQDSQEAPGGSQEAQDSQEAPGGSQEAQEGRDASKADLDGPWLDASPTVDDIAANHDAVSVYSTDQRRSWLNSFREAVCTETPASQYPARVDMVRFRIARPAVLADSVSRLVLSEACNSRERYLSAGRFDRRAMGRATWGAGNVFSRRVYAEGIETAVFLLIDGSTSMESDGRIEDARSLAYHLGQAIDAAGARCAIGAFYVAESYDQLAGFRIFLRMAKDWQEPTDIAKLANIQVAGTTPLSPGIIAAARMLEDVRDVQRRILIPITDGGCDLGADAVRDACGVANAMGVEVGAIGIGGGTDCQTTFPIGVDLGTGANLSEAGLNLLVDMLDRGRA